MSYFTWRLFFMFFFCLREHKRHLSKTFLKILLTPTFEQRLLKYFWRECLSLLPKHKPKWKHLCIQNSTTHVCKGRDSIYKAERVPSLSIFPMPTFSFSLNKTLDHMRNPLSSSASLYWALRCIGGHIINARKTVLLLSTSVASGNERSNIKMSGTNETQVNRSMTGHCTEGEKENNLSAKLRLSRGKTH